MKKNTYKNITSPVFLGYYYKDEKNQDQKVKVRAMLKMFDQLGTAEDLKMKQAFPNVGDHVIAGELFSKSLDDVAKATFDFAENMLKLKPIYISNTW